MGKKKGEKNKSIEWGGLLGKEKKVFKSLKRKGGRKGRGKKKGEKSKSIEWDGLLGKEKEVFKSLKRKGGRKGRGKKKGEKGKRERKRRRRKCLKSNEDTWLATRKKIFFEPWQLLCS